MNAPGLECSANTPEVGNPATDRAQIKQRRGVAADTGAGRKSGKTPEKVRNKSGISQSHLSLTPSSPATGHCSGAALLLKPGKPRRPAPAAADRAPTDPALCLVPCLPPKTPREVRPAKPPMPHGDYRPSEPGRHTLTKRGRVWAVRDAAGELVALVLSRKGAAEVVRRLDVATGGRP